MSVYQLISDLLSGIDVVLYSEYIAIASIVVIVVCLCLFFKAICSLLNIFTR